MRKAISKERWDEIKSEYRHIPNKDKYSRSDECRQADDWEMVYQIGCDSKYGGIMVSEKMRAWHNPDIWEFYGGGAID